MSSGRKKALPRNSVTSWIPTNALNRSDCPSRTVLEVISSKWTLYILSALRAFERPVRFYELRDLLEGVTQKMLTQTLRSLERDGLVCRTVHATIPPQVEYQLSALGLEVGEITTALAQWSIDHVHEIHNSRARYDQPLHDSNSRHPKRPQPDER